MVVRNLLTSNKVYVEYASLTVFNRTVRRAAKKIRETRSRDEEVDSYSQLY
jgi:hypothetical protein